MHTRQILASASLLGLDQNFIRVLDNLHPQHERVFGAQEHMSLEFAQVKHGLLQGCPLSPLLLASVLLAWERRAAEVESDQTMATVYVDDRTL